MAAGRQFHLPRRARLQALTAIRWSPISKRRSASCARASCACSGAATSCSNSRRRSWRFCKEPRLLIIAKANVHARVHRRVYLDYIGVKRFDAVRQSGRRIPHHRAVHLDRLYAHRAQHSLSAPQDRAASKQRAGFDPNSHSGKALANVLEHYPRDELFQIDEDTLYRFRARDSAARRASARARAGAARPLRPLRLGAGVRAARTLRQPISAPRSATIWRAPSSAVSRPFIRSSRKARWCACTSSSAVPAARRRQVDRATLEDRSRRRSCAAGAMGLTTALALVNPPDKARELFARYRDAFSEGFHEAYAPAVAAGDIRVIEGLSERASARRRFPSPARGRAARGRPESLELRPAAAAVGTRAGAGKHGLPGGGRAHLSMIEPAGEAARRLVPRHAAGAQRRRRDRSRRRQGAARSRLPDGDARRRRERRLQRADARRRPGLARRGADPRAVALSAPDPRALFAGLYVGDAGEAFRDRRRHRRTVSRPLRPASRSRARSATPSRKRSPRASRSELQKVESLDEDRILRHFVNAVQSAIRTNFYQTDKDGQPKALIAVKFESGKLTDLPLPRPLYEIFVYSPRVEGVHMRFGKVARGGIRWSDRPQDFRTEILGLVKAQQVKNAVIVPVGAKGGFVPKLMPKGARAKSVQAEGVATYKLFMSTLLDITDNIGADGKIIPPDRRGAPRRRRSLSRGRRRQGHRDVLRHRQRDFASSTTTGWATPSPPAARPATTTRSWASPRAAPGNRSSAISARWTSTSGEDAVHRASASATCRATCSATACCARTPPSCWRRSTTATSSSIPTPIRKRPSPSASGCSRCRARAGRTTTRR